MATPPIPNQQNSSGLMGQQYKQYQQQQRQRQSSVGGVRLGGGVMVLSGMRSGSPFVNCCSLAKLQLIF
jgi:hypothetical protein